MKANNRWEEIVAAILRHRDFVIVGHSIADGDCVGSVIGLTLGLGSMGKHVTAVLDEEVPRMYRFLKGANLVRKPAELEAWPAQAIYLDCSDIERVGEKLVPYLSGCTTVINIDHHISNSFFGHYNRVEPETASTAELVLKLLDKMGAEISPAIANAVYTGILMDTGSFQYSNTRTRTLRTAARLLEQGVDIDMLRVNLFESRSRAEVRLLQKALASLQFSPDGRVAWMSVTYRELVEMGALQEHFEGLINYARSIEGVEVGLLFREIEPGIVKIGLRSKTQVDVNKIAARLGGGGHPRAAGAQMEGDIDQVQEEVVRLVGEVVAACTGS